MKTFQIGETVVCYIEVYKSSALYNPIPDSGDAVTVVIYDSGGTAVLGSETPQALGNETTGKYSYSWSTTGKSAGVYRARFVATDGATISKKDASFKLEA
jgi:hypothetical protein